MRNRSFIFILIFIGFVLPANSFARRVRFSGNPGTLAESIERLAASTLSDNQVLDSSTTILVDAGYLDAECHIDDSILVVEVGERAMLSSVTFLSDTTIVIAMPVPFTKDNLNGIVTSRIEYRRNEGYYFASATVQRIERNDQMVHLVLNLNIGPQVTIGKRVIEGLVRSRPTVIEKYLPRSEGVVLTDEEVRSNERAAERIPFVTFYPPVTIVPRVGYTLADLKLSFKEIKQFHVEGTGGILSGQSSAFVWSLDFRFQNMFGSGRMVRVRSERRESGRNLLNIRYEQPLFLGGVGSWSTEVATRNYLDIFYEFSLSSSYQLDIGSKSMVGVGAAWKTVEPATAGPGYSSFAASFSAGTSTLDKPFNPGRGLNLKTTIVFAFRRYRDDSGSVEPERNSLNETRSRIDINYFQPLWGNFLVHLGAVYFGLETEELLPPISELYLVGGPGTIRGFRNEQFVVQRAALLTLEPRLRSNSNFVFSFLDFAYLNWRAQSSTGPVTLEEFEYGYGLGLGIQNPGRSVEISLGWSRRAPFDEPRLSVQLSSDI